MPTETYFNNIRERIVSTLNKATHRIIVCVAWLTDELILQTLIDKSKNSIHVEIITQNDEYNRGKAPYFNKLISSGCKVYLLDKNLTGGILHHKFCVIDGEILITGSYNWTNNANKNTENIIIKTLGDEDDDIISSYNSEFEKILIEHGIKDENEEWDKASATVEEGLNKSRNQIDEAKEFYDKALKLYRLDKYNEALEFIDDAIIMTPYSNHDFTILRHTILRHLGRYSESLDELINCLDNLSIGQNDFIDDFRAKYESFMKSVKSANNSFKVIPVLNEKTKANKSSFERWGIEPHIFSFDELDPLPF